MDVDEGSNRVREQEFSAYVAGRHASLVRTAYLLCGDASTAEDVVQTVWIKLYAAWHRVERNLDAYVRRMVVNEVHQLGRRPWRRERLGLAAVDDGDSPVPTHDADPDGRVWQALRDLPPRQRAVVVLRYYDDRSEAEIAEILQISAGTVKSQASRALASMRTALEHEEAR